MFVGKGHGLILMNQKSLQRDSSSVQVMLLLGLELSCWAGGTGQGGTSSQRVPPPLTGSLPALKAALERPNPGHTQPGGCQKLSLQGLDRESAHLLIFFLLQPFPVNLFFFFYRALYCTVVG